MGRLPAEPSFQFQIHSSGNAAPCNPNRAAAGDRNDLRMTTGRPIEILLVEDNPGDVELTRELVQAGKVRNVIRSVGGCRGHGLPAP